MESKTTPDSGGTPQFSFSIDKGDIAKVRFLRSVAQDVIGIERAASEQDPNYDPLEPFDWGARGALDLLYMIEHRLLRGGQLVDEDLENECETAFSMLIDAFQEAVIAGSSWALERGSAR